MGRSLKTMWRRGQPCGDSHRGDATGAYREAKAEQRDKTR